MISFRTIILLAIPAFIIGGMIVALEYNDSKQSQIVMNDTKPVVNDPELAAFLKTIPYKGELISSVDTSNWNEYVNEEYGFRMKYPAVEWDVVKVPEYDVSRKASYISVGLWPKEIGGGKRLFDIREKSISAENSLISTITKEIRLRDDFGVIDDTYPFRYAVYYTLKNGVPIIEARYIMEGEDSGLCSMYFEYKEKIIEITPCSIDEEELNILSSLEFFDN